MPSIGVGQIFTVGNTVALAWELPHDPFVPFRRPSELLHRIDKPEKHTSGGWTLQNSNSPAPVTYMKTYYNPFLINKPPAPGYTTINGFSPKLSGANQGFTKTKSNHYKTYKNHNQYRTVQNAGVSKAYHEPVTSYLHPVFHKIYRRTRRDLYAKIERLFTALSKDGRACLLKAVCEVSRATREKGTFIEEIVKAIFRVRHHQDEGHEEKDEYDLAANEQHDCKEMYPTCEHSIWNGIFAFSNQ
ncbi:DM4 12 domain containing protein [Asbolus verrucosus]|uniref:DM4 12 domain containing protein n=1 Tax=Asbolus verrucosus TaxID=1661398 RepID=A0A482V7Y4_ASBVE|nr:DM4 12 domain containing protein [Asbolus verrucosus]